MNCIITILGVSQEDYLSIREDLQLQLRDLGVDPLPLFARLPADYTGIEIVWIEKPEKERVAVYNNVVNTKSDSPADDFRAMQMIAGA